MNIDHVEAVPQKSSENEKAEKKNIDCEKEDKEKTDSQEVYGWKGLEEEGKGSLPDPHWIEVGQVLVALW